MLKEYRADVAVNPTVPFLIHFRISTSGLIDGDNTHPHRVRDDMVMAHNGHITGYGDKEKSDTLEFVELILKGMPARWEEDPIQTHLIERYINRDKLVLLRGDGEYVILNEEAGVWKDKLWFSNKSYEKRPVVKGFQGHGINYGVGNPKSYASAKGKVTSPAAYTACGWESDGESTFPFYSDGDGRPHFETFLDEECAYCSLPLDAGDAEFNIQLDAWYPICSDCVIDKEKELVKGGVIADAVTQIWDEVFDKADEDGMVNDMPDLEKEETPATSRLLAPIFNVFSS